jgi:hypothetical protein
VCTDPADCHPCGNSSPLVDAECPDADEDDGEAFDASDDDVLDAGTNDASDANDEGDAADADAVDAE